MLDVPGMLGAWPLLAVFIRHLGEALFIIFLFVFPDGRFQPRWTRVAAALWVVFTVSSFVADHIASQPAEGLLWIQLSGQTVWLMGGVAALVIATLAQPLARQLKKVIDHTLYRARGHRWSSRRASTSSSWFLSWHRVWPGTS